MEKVARPQGVGKREGRKEGSGAVVGAGAGAEALDLGVDTDY